LSTSGPLGGKNLFLSIAFLVVGEICIAIAIVFFEKKKLQTMSLEENENDLFWNKIIKQFLLIM